MTRLNAVVVEVRNENGQQAANEYELKYPKSNNPYNDDALRADWMARHAEDLEKVIERARSLQCVATFSDGTSFSTSDFDEFVSVLDKGPGFLNSVAVIAGTYSNLRISLSLEQRAGYVIQLDVSGDRRNVNHIDQLCNQLFREARPEIAFFHSGLFSFICVFTIWVLAAVVLAVSQARFAVQPSVLWNLLSGFVIGAGALTAVEQFQKLFPKLDFGFGRQSRRRKYLVSAIVWCAGVVILPILINAAFFALSTSLPSSGESAMRKSHTNETRR